MIQQRLYISRCYIAYHFITEQWIDLIFCRAFASVIGGALYRWKRKQLIPDAWFIHRSTYTGQETFFPAKLVCERVETILSMKEDVLLDELARQLSGEEKRNEFIVLDTEFGEKSFRICDVRSIRLVNREGDSLSITAEIQRMLAELRKGKQE